MVKNGCAAGYLLLHYTEGDGGRIGALVLIFWFTHFGSVAAQSNGCWITGRQGAFSFIEPADRTLPTGFLSLKEQERMWNSEMNAAPSCCCNGRC